MCTLITKLSKQVDKLGSTWVKTNNGLFTAVSHVVLTTVFYFLIFPVHSASYYLQFETFSIYGYFETCLARN